MGTSDITVTALTATATIRGNKLNWTVTDPRNGTIPSIALDRVDIYASTTNDFATAAVVESGITDTLHPGLIEEQTYYYWAIPYNMIHSPGARFPAGATSGVACTAIGISGLAFGLANGKLVTTVSANALTVAVKTAAGNDPSSSDPVFIAFPSETLTVGRYVIRQITSALSLVVSSGSTLGVTGTGVPFRLWFVLFDDSGTLRLGVKFASASLTNINTIKDGEIVSSTAEGGAGAADSGDFFYTSVACTSKTYRIVGYADWSSGLGTIGVWNTAPDITRLAGSEMSYPGEVLETKIFFSSTVQATHTTLIPWDDTIPQLGEGSQIFGITPLTPRSPANIIEAEILLNVSHSVASQWVASLHRFPDTDAIASAVAMIPSSDTVVQVYLKTRFRALTTSPPDMRISGGAVTAGTWTFNGVAGARKLGGALNSYYIFRELAG